MKNLIQSLFSFFGYRLVKENYLSSLIHKNRVGADYIYLLLQKRYNTEKDLIFFDIGANIGQTTERMKKYFPESIVYSFEPISDTFEQLVKNTGQLKNVKTFQVALGSEEGSIEVFHRRDSEWNSLLPQLNETAQKEGADSETIQVTTLDKFVSENQITKIHFLKSDTEGFELEVIEGGRITLQNGVVDYFLVEVGTRKDDIQHVNWKEVVEKMEELDFSFAGFYDTSFSETLHINYSNALFVKKGFKF